MDGQLEAPAQPWHPEGIAGVAFVGEKVENCFDRPFLLPHAKQALGLSESVRAKCSKVFLQAGQVYS
jgi:hypothetical protein